MESINKSKRINHDEVIKKLSKEHLRIMFKIKYGATVFGLEQATLIREIEQIESSLVTIVTGEKLERIVGEANMYTNKNPRTGKLAYFGAILTAKGKKILSEACQKKGLHFCWQDEYGNFS